MVGVAKTAFNAASPVANGSFQRPWGWVYDIGTGCKCHSGKREPYADAASQNDKIGVLCDLDKGELTFFKNKVNLGVAFSGLRGFQVAPVVEIVTAHDRVKIVPARRPHNDQQKQLGE